MVEDDAAAGRLISKALEREGYQVMVAPNGQEALALAEQNDWGFDMVLTDVIMPVMNGPELVAKLRRGTCPELSALFMSGYTDDVLARQGFSIEDVDLIRKPFSPGVSSAGSSLSSIVDPGTGKTPSTGHPGVQSKCFSARATCATSSSAISRNIRAVAGSACFR